MSLLTRLFLYAALCCFPLGTQAGEMRTGTGVVCDTKEQVAQVVVAKPVDVEAAIQTVNAVNDRACGRITIAFIKGEKVGTIYGEVSAYELYEITVLGVYDGSWKVVHPIKQFTAFRVPGRRT